MATPSQNDTNSNQNPSAPENDEEILDLYDLDLRQERVGKARNKRITRRYALAIVCCGGVVMLPWILLLAFFSPWTQTSTLEWPEGVQVSVEEKFSSGMDGDVYDCTISQFGREITSVEGSGERWTIKQGSSQGTPYFYSQELIGICRSVKTDPTTWVTWSSSSDSLTSWMNRFSSARRKLRKKHKEEEFFQEPNYEVVDFKVQGRTWIIGLHDSYWPSDEYSEGDGGTPTSLHVESRNLGATWKVKEPIAIPSWLDEIHQK